ncbi:Thaumatin-like protein 1 [Stylosanthes scabra]|uniref:Thaumatin-like protein 1 n=1 Tax=Stylosanthes scabra TaxID=79078 RepID=A0ABU6QA73_9FABA|nr:Thaumatin-like protein 1 [Stylosanthes scabra]
MALFSYHRHSSHPFYALFLFLLLKGGSAATFTFVNKCDHTVWPGILGKPEIGTTGFELSKASTKTFQAPTGWSGRFWGRTDCQFDSSGKGTCATADCGSGEINCNGGGASPPATLAEFTLGTGSMDYYDVSLVDGYNLPMMVEASGGSGSCGATGCGADLNTRCPSELRVEGGNACRSACDAFKKAEYCCDGEFGNPNTCKPSVYSEMFKSACPKSYSYAYDDATSTFTCSNADYTITFCPSSPSLKSSTDSSSPTPNATGSASGSGSDLGSGSGSSVEQSALGSTSWLADMATATGSSASRRREGYGYGYSILVAVAFFLFCVLID